MPEEIVQLFAHQFAVDVRNIPVEYSSKGLRPWELACCYIDNDIPLIRIRTSNQPFQNAVLFHELVHASRSRLHSPIFEEHTAYAACATFFPEYVAKWRAWMGPLFPSSSSVTVLLLQTWLWWIFPAFFDQVPLWIGFGACFYPFILSVQLFRRWKTWQKAFDAISRRWPRSAWALFLRLHDSDIQWLSTLKRDEVVEEIRMRARSEWRWQFLYEKLLQDL
jgi:hypothetical protein